MKRKIWTVLFLLIVVCISTGMLNAVYIHTAPLVRRNEEAKTQKGVLEIFHIPYDEISIQRTFDENVDVDAQTVKGIKLYKSRCGSVAFQISGPGFWGEISAIVALESDLETIRELRILKNTETPGLGGRITESWFQDQFKGKKATPELKILPYGTAQKPNEVDAITGATQTSRAFERIINNNIGFLRSRLIR